MLVGPRQRVEKLLCRKEHSIYDALRQIDGNAKGVLFVVDDAGHFEGTLTEGDLRRAILSRKGTETLLADLLRGKSSFSMPASTPVRALVKAIGPGLRIIPLLDDRGAVVDYFELKASFHAPIAATALGGNELAYVMECVTSNWISSQGGFITRFEEEFAACIGMPHGVAVMNGTVAIHLALVALGIGPGDEVIVPDLTFAATVNPVIWTGATPVLCDVEENSWCLDPAAVEKAITPRTRAIIPVHLYGQVCDLEALGRLADAHGIHIVEDCAECHGAEFGDRKAGSFGAISCFSFFANKILTTGEGGMCLTRDPTLAEKMRVLRDHGMRPERRYWHERVGYNYRMTNLQAAVGVAQLERFGELLARREQIRGYYDAGLAGCPEIVLQRDLPARRRVTWLYSALWRAPGLTRDAFIGEMKTQGVDARPFFHPLSSMPPYAAFARFPTPVSRRLSAEGFSLPTVVTMEEAQYRAVIGKVLYRLRRDPSWVPVPPQEVRGDG